MNGNKTPKDVKTEMRRKEPQAGDASAELIELRRRQAEAAGVYKKGYAKPLRVDSPAGTDLEADLNPEEGGRTPGSFKGFDQDTAPDEDTLHMDLVRTFDKRGRDSKRIYEAAKKRREAKKTRTASGRPGPGPGGGDPPKRSGLTETNTDIYKKNLPEHLHNNPDALDAAAKDAAKKNWEDKFSRHDPVKDEKFTLDGKEYDKVTYPGGEVFIIGDGEVYRDHDTAASGPLFDFDAIKNTAVDSALFTPAILKHSAEEAEGRETMPKGRIDNKYDIFEPEPVYAPAMNHFQSIVRKIAEEDGS
jgi:hypothetical protein